MENYEPFVSLLVALGVGLIIGLEREQSAASGAKHSLGGVRTFPLVALSGAVSTLLSTELGGFVFAVALAGVLGFGIASYVNDLRNDSAPGITTEVALLMTFLLGALATSTRILTPLSHKLIVVSATGIATTSLLSFREPLHGFVRKISSDDIYATVKFLIVSVIVLPLLPNEPLGPLAAFNPFVTGLMVVLIAAVAFIGYIAVRVLGAGRGLGVTGLVGGFVSSTAVTLSMSARAKSDAKSIPGCALAVTLASTVMFFRMLAIILVLGSDLFGRVAIALGAMGLGGLVASAWLYFASRRSDVTTEEVKFTNPFELTSALKFAALFTLVLFASKAATLYLGERGTYLAGILSGTTDVDAITVSIVKLAKEGMDANVAATTIVLAAIANTIVKAGLAFILGGAQFGRKILQTLGSALVAGGIGLLVLWLL